MKRDLRRRRTNVLGRRRHLGTSSAGIPPLRVGQEYDYGSTKETFVEAFPARAPADDSIAFVNDVQVFSQVAPSTRLSSARTPDVCDRPMKNSSERFTSCVSLSHSTFFVLSYLTSRFSLTYPYNVDEVGCSNKPWDRALNVMRVCNN